VRIKPIAYPPVVVQRRVEKISKIDCHYCHKFGQYKKKFKLKEKEKENGKGKSKI